MRVGLLDRAIDVFQHLDGYLNLWAEELGPGLYAILFLIVFCETGLVVTPFLPGDSLLFAVGALTATDGCPISLGGTIVILVAAGVLGDAANYAIGLRVGPRVFKSETGWLLNRAHLLRAQAFYDRHGGKTIVLARFIPILRTFAPFVAGIGKMGYPRFAAFNVAGAALWVVGFALLGHSFGNLPVVKRNFQIVILAIVVISTIPVAVEFAREWKRRRAGAPTLEPAPQIEVEPEEL